MKTYIFQIETTVIEEYYIESDSLEQAEKDILDLGSIDDNKTNHSVNRVTFIGVEND